MNNIAYYSFRILNNISINNVINRTINNAYLSLKMLKKTNYSYCKSSCICEN